MELFGRFGRLMGLAAAAATLVIFGTAVSQAMAAGPAVASRHAPVLAAVHSAGAVPQSLSQCPNNWMCAWESAGYAGRIIEMQTGCSNFVTCFPSNFNDVTSSMANFTPSFWCFYTDINYGGMAYQASPGAQIEYVGGFWNDQFSSAHVEDFFHTC